jgi:teichuronic acid biosynthesis glycosyltransferase TuaH
VEPVTVPERTAPQAGTAVDPPDTVASHDVVFTFYRETWSDAVHRDMYMAGDRLVDSLLVRPDVRRLVVGNPYRSAPIQLVRRLAGQRPARFPESSDRMLVEPLRLRRDDPRSVRALERACVAYDRVLERAADEVGAEDPVVITTSPFVAGFAPLRWARQVTFYAWDDWASGVPVRRWWPAYEEAYVRVREAGRAVVAVSEAIVDRIRPTGPAAVVPNGVAPEEWRTPAAPPHWFAALPRPRILYVGVLGERLDTAAVREVATRFGQGTVVLVGPVEDEAPLRSLRSLANVHIEPPVGRADVAAVVRAADVCILPHRSTRLTHAMSPLKLYEYLAGGGPVAATDLPPVRAADPRIVTVPREVSFADGVAEALDRGPLTDEERLRFIDANSWRARHDDLLGVAFGPPASPSPSGPHGLAIGNGPGR